MIDDTKVIMQYLEHLQEMFGAEIKVVTSGNIWIDFIAPGTNKGAALSNLMKLFHVKPEECMAFGDQYNDLEMLELVGHSYAMSNSAPGVSYYADEVTDSVEDVLEIIWEKFQCHLHILTVVHMLICVNMILSDRKCFQIICLFRKSDFSSLIWYIKWFFYSIQLNILWLRPGWSSCLCINTCPD